MGINRRWEILVVNMSSTKLHEIDVAENIVVFRVTGEEFNDGNITCIAMNDGLIFIDAGRKTERTAKFRADMEKKFNKKTKMFLLTHYHWDHYQGIAAFKDVPLFASQLALEANIAQYKKGHLTSEARKQYADGIIEESKKGTFDLSEEWHSDWAPTFINAELYPLQYGIKDQLTINKGEKEILFKVIGGHTECSAYLHYLPDNILITGDNFNCFHASNSGCMLGGINWNGIEILKEFEKINPTKVIPGHGPIVENDYIIKTRKFFEEMFTKLKELKEKGMPIEDAIKDKNLPEFFEEEKHKLYDHILSDWYEKL
jgi:glyoxylase-like metal-dependent hydrolase (beta-lactamase superfamily II)